MLTINANVLAEAPQWGQHKTIGSARNPRNESRQDFRPSPSTTETVDEFRDKNEKGLRIHRLQSTKRSPFDAFIYVNRIPVEPESDETQEDLAGRILGRLANQEGRILVKLPPGMNRLAYQGFKIALGSENRQDFRFSCFACHHLPNLGQATLNPLIPSMRNHSISNEQLRRLLENETTAETLDESR